MRGEGDGGRGLCVGKGKGHMVSCFKDLHLFHKYLLNESLVGARGEDGNWGYSSERANQSLHGF